MPECSELLTAVREVNLQKIFEEMTRLFQGTPKEQHSELIMNLACALSQQNLDMTDLQLIILLEKQIYESGMFLKEDKEQMLGKHIVFLKEIIIHACFIQEQGIAFQDFEQKIDLNLLRENLDANKSELESFKSNAKAPSDEIQRKVAMGIDKYFNPSLQEITALLSTNQPNDLSFQYALEKLDELEKQEASTPPHWFSRTNDKMRSIQETRQLITKKLKEHKSTLSRIVEIKREIAELEASIVGLSPQISELETQIDNSAKLLENKESLLKKISANEQKRLNTLEKIETIESLIINLEKKSKKLEPEKFQSSLDSLTSQKEDEELISNNLQAVLQSQKDSLRIIEQGLESIDLSDQKLKLYALEIKRTSYSGKCIAARARLEAVIKEIAPEEPAASRIKQLSQMPIDNIEKQIQEINKKIEIPKASNATQSRFGAFKAKLSSLFKEKTPSLQTNQDATKSCISWFSLLSCFKRSNEEKSSKSTFLSIIFKVFQDKKTPKPTSTNDIELLNSTNHRPQ